MSDKVDNLRLTSGKGPMRINLQLFAGEGDKVPLVNPLLAEDAPPAPVEGAQGQAQTPPAAAQTEPSQVAQPQEQPLILGKFKNQEELANSYKNLEGFSTNKSQEAAQYKKELETTKELLATLANNLKNPQPGAPAVNQPVQKTPEQVQAENEELWEKLTNDPIGTLTNLIQQTVNPMVKPINERFEKEDLTKSWKDAALQFARATDQSGNLIHPDFGDEKIQAGMTEAFNTYPELGNDPKSIEIAYNYAKGKAAGNIAPVDTAALLNNPEFIEKNVLNNQELVNMILQKHMETIKNNTPPPTIAGQSGGTIPATPPEKPKTLGEAGKQVLNFFGLGK